MHHIQANSPQRYHIQAALAWISRHRSNICLRNIDAQIEAPSYYASHLQNIQQLIQANSANSPQPQRIHSTAHTNHDSQNQQSLSVTNYVFIAKQLHCNKYIVTLGTHTLHSAYKARLSEPIVPLGDQLCIYCTSMVSHSSRAGMDFFHSAYTPQRIQITENMLIAINTQLHLD